MIKTVIRTAGDMVMVFDENGEQIPEFQGYYEDVKDKVLTGAAAGSVFNHWFGRSLDPDTVTAEVW
ncbi:MAG: hypothetical protein A2Z29_05725 [Chloroflexi bacterium RBG_16_56_11]|nr:MAG: hypothetical protein A2Z29_05725 [Chloroflexi bacterium RBG_16_56_11]